MIEYPGITTDDEYAAALKGRAATDRLREAVDKVAQAICEAGEADPDLAPALRNFCLGLYDLVGELMPTLQERDEALAAYEALMDGSAWEPAPGQRESNVYPLDIRRRP